MMCVENPESFRDTICVAPAEGERPLNIMTDAKFEAMSNCEFACRRGVLKKFAHIRALWCSEPNTTSIRGLWVVMTGVIPTCFIT